jgi:hypothetical protein
MEPTIIDLSFGEVIAALFGIELSTKELPNSGSGTLIFNSRGG